MNDEAMDSPGFGNFNSLESYIEELGDDGSEAQMMYDMLSQHISPESMRQTDIQGFLSQIDQTKMDEAGVEWLGNPFVVCTGGIKRSPLTIQFLKDKIGEDQHLINQELPKTAMGGFNAMELAKIDEDLARIGEKIFTAGNKNEVNTVIFHMSPQEGDLSPFMSLVQLNKLLGVLNPAGDREQLELRLLLVIDDEATVTDAYRDRGITIT